MAEVPFLDISYCLEIMKMFLINLEVRVEVKRVIDNHIPNSRGGGTNYFSINSNYSEFLNGLFHRFEGFYKEGLSVIGASEFKTLLKYWSA